MMLYLVHPRGPMQWSDVPPSVSIDSLREHGIDITKLDWREAEVRADGTTIRLALRYGMASTAGIVVEGHTLSDLHHIAFMSSAYREAQSGRDRLASSDAFLERLMPGWEERGRRLDAEINASVAKAIREAENDVAALIDDAAPDPALVTLWESLGGDRPNPL